MGRDEDGKMEDGSSGQVRRSCQCRDEVWDFLGIREEEGMVEVELVVDKDMVETTEVAAVVRVDGTGALKENGGSHGRGGTKESRHYSSGLMGEGRCWTDRGMDLLPVRLGCWACLLPEGSP